MTVEIIPTVGESLKKYFSVHFGDIVLGFDISPCSTCSKVLTLPDSLDPPTLLLQRRHCNLPYFKEARKLTADAADAVKLL